MPCGVVLREVLKHEAVAAIILYDESRANGKAANIDQIDPHVTQSGDGIFWKFFPWIDGGAFEVSTDAFTTFRVRLQVRKDEDESGTDHGRRSFLLGTSNSWLIFSLRISISSFSDTTPSSYNRILTSPRGSQ